MKAKSAPMSRKSPPPATLKKRLIHTFYLVQPVIQFFALVAIIGILSRCSPLAPSTDKTIGLKSKNGTPELETTENSQNIARESLIAQNLVEVGSAQLEVISEENYEKNAKQSIAREKEIIEDSKLKSRLNNRIGSNMRGEQKKKHFLSLRLNEDQTAQLIDDGLIRIDLAQSMVLSDQGKKVYFNAMHDSLHAVGVKKIDAAGYMIFEDEAARDAHKDLSQSMQLKVFLSIIAENQAYLEIRVEAASAEARHDAIANLDEALQDSGHLAIVLE